MNREQKRALTILITMSAVIVLAVAAVTMKTLHLRRLGVLLLPLVAATACVGGIVYFRLRPKAGVAFDERDREIQRNANLAGFGVTYFLLGLGSFVPALILGEETAISVAWLPLMVSAAMTCHGYAFFGSLVIQYGRTKEEMRHE